ncbi:TlpA family protein disulfide reductase [Flavilitoribacter nigricans]|uniref:Thioredoxin domain-containing protein n=1 Tax=Flavilitoribacter nigricans (strain ATCC 23147 / DSM 23189 / NBRC 102662 / NCIMB 1420 / SS-2) TaxID=1122177 RepID=A0A2D0MWF9_FLAN2|nr:TlpA disulfide reductase family protein [Flavilitoribacter nigricans]PHN00537.1 hypothetical protein CRP01_41750 [Flavilitoribacter nigricans DSM 23189 = NBRC 102662]
MYTLEKIYQTKLSGIHFYPETALKEGILSVVEQERYRGRVLFLDIWGTWCGPCRDEFPHMQKVKDELQDAEITYLYFSDEKTEAPEAHWMKTVKFYNLKGDHYLVKKDLIFQFLKDIDQYKPMFSYPTYMIVNRRGEIIDHAAPNPSDKEALLAALRKALAEE